MRKRLLAPLADLALTAALIAGCGPAPGAAGSVDGHAITESEVAAVVDDINDLTYGQVAQLEAQGQDIDDAAVQQVLLQPRSALTALVLAPVVLEVSSESGVGVSAAQAAARWQQNAAQFGVDDGRELSDATLDYIRSQLALAAVAQSPDGASLLAEINARAAELDVTLSPRYGEWSDGEALSVSAEGQIVDTGAVVVSAPSWLVVAPTTEAE